MASKTSKAFDALLSAAGYLSYDQLATDTGVARHTLWRWRTSGPPKRRSTLVATVAKKLKITPAALVRTLSRKRVA
jgi:DNA-binding phage protein